MYRDVVDAEGFVVWERVQGGEPLTLGLCRRVVAELGSMVNAASIVQWHREAWVVQRR